MRSHDTSSPVSSSVVWGRGQLGVCWVHKVAGTVETMIICGLVCVLGSLGLYSREAVVVGFDAVCLGVVERLHLLSSGLLVSSLIFSHQASAVVEQITRQQEAAQGGDQEADVYLKDTGTNNVKMIAYSNSEDINRYLFVTERNKIFKYMYKYIYRFRSHI